MTRTCYKGKDIGIYSNRACFVGISFSAFSSQLNCHVTLSLASKPCCLCHQVYADLSLLLITVAEREPEPVWRVSQITFIFICTLGQLVCWILYCNEQWLIFMEFKDNIALVTVYTIYVFCCWPTHWSLNGVPQRSTMPGCCLQFYSTKLRFSKTALKVKGHVIYAHFYFPCRVR